MGASRIKFITISAILIWGGFVIYLLSNTGNLNKYQGSLNNGVKWASQFLPSDLIKDNGSLSVDNSTPLSDSLQNVSRALPVNVVMQAGESNLGGLVAAVNSAIINSKRRKSLNFFFILPENDVEHLKEWMKVAALKDVAYTFRVLPKDFEANPGIAKVLFTDLFPDLQGPIIYMDSDVVVQGDLAELVHSQAPHKSYGLFSDDCHTGSASKMKMLRGDAHYGKRIHLNHPTVIKMQEKLEIHINPVACTFSSSVFVAFDADKWRKEVSPKVISMLHVSTNQSILGAQGGTDLVEAALLIVLYGRTSPLDPLWHIRNLGITPAGSRYSANYLTNAKLIHWSGHFKPWHRRAPEQQLWDRYFIDDPRGKFKPIRKSL